MTASLPHVEVILATARGHGDALVHLVAPFGARALCGRMIRVRQVQASFHQAGCPDCLALALAAGDVAARDADGSRLDLLQRPRTSAPG